jgi:hypothetical protein
MQLDFNFVDKVSYYILMTIIYQKTLHQNEIIFMEKVCS